MTRPGPTSHIGLVTAFFDDHDEPLTLSSPLFAGDELLKDLSLLLAQDQFDLFFFDEHDRELMGMRAHNESASRFRAEICNATFAELDIAAIQQSLGRLDRRFVTRDASDDAKAFAIKLGERLYPDDLFIIDARDEARRFDHRGSVAFTSIERKDPGPYQERDIAAVLSRVFDGDCIYLNPMRADTGKELTDVLVVTDHLMLFIQAKDSPNTEAIMRRSIGRKRAIVRAHIQKAVDQLRGALDYARKNDGITLRTDCASSTMPIAERQLVGLVVVREMFDDDYVACTAPLLKVVRELEMPAILLDYSGLHIMAENLRTPAQLVNGLFDMLDVALEHEQFPKPIWSGPPPEAMR